MITLENGDVQGANGLPIVPFGFIELYLTGDATIIAPPYGQVLGGTKNAVRFYFDQNCNLVSTPPPQIWSNSELNPQNSEGLGTAYVVNFFDENGTILNNGPMVWVFPNASGSTVDIGTMTSLSGNRVYYPLPFLLVPEPANYVLAGPTSGSPALPTFRPISTLVPNFVDDEVPGGTIDGTNATFTLVNAPNPAASLNLFKNGQRLTAGIGFTLSGSTITYMTIYIPQVNDTHLANYRY